MQGISKRRLQTKACIAGAKTFLMLFNIIFWFVDFSVDQLRSCPQYNNSNVCLTSVALMTGMTGAIIIVGLIVLVCGLWMKASIARLFEVSQFHFALPSLFIVTGVVMLCIGVFACCCTSKEKPTLLFTLSIFFFVVFILVFSASITGYVYRDNLKESLHNSLNQTLLEYGGGGILDKDWDRIQQNLKCCGVDNYRDWIYTEWANENRTFPSSCCHTTRICDNTDETQIFQNGCYREILGLLSNNLNGIGVGMLLIAFFQIIGMGLSCCLALNINKALYEEMLA